MNSILNNKKFSITMHTLDRIIKTEYNLMQKKIRKKLNPLFFLIIFVRYRTHL